MKLFSSIRIVVYVVIMILFSNNLFAGQRFWVATTAANWNATTSWSLSSAGGSGASVPGSSDTAIFDGGVHGNRNGSCTINATASVKAFWANSGYSATITQSSTLTIGTTGGNFSGCTFTNGATFSSGTGLITINGSTFNQNNTINFGSGGLTISSGSFVGNTTGTFNVAFVGTLTISGGAFTAPKDNLNLKDFTKTSGTFSYQTGSTVIFGDGTHTINLGGTENFNNVTFSATTFSSSCTATINSNTTIVVNGTLTENPNLGPVTLNTGNIQAKGNISLMSGSTGGGGNTVITITGTATQTLTGSGTSGQTPLPSVVINKSSGTLTLSSIISVAKNWTWTAGSLSVGTSTVVFVGSSKIKGNHTLANVTFTNSASADTITVANSTTLTVSSTFSIGGTAAIRIDSGTVSAQAGFTVSNTSSTAGGGIGKISLSGSSTQTITGTSTGTENLCNVSFDKSGGDITMSNNITVTGTLTFNGTSAYKINSGTIYSTGNIAFGSSSTLNRGSGTIEIKGASVNQSITGTTSGAGILPNIKINKSGSPKTFTINSAVSVGGTWNHAAGRVVAATSSKVIFNPLSKQSIIGNDTLAKIAFTNPASTQDTIYIRNGNIIIASDSFLLTGIGPIKLDSGTVYAQSHISFTNSSNSGIFGMGTININGSGSQTFSSTTASTKAVVIPHLTIAKTGGSTLTVSGYVPVGGNFTLTSGTMSMGTSTVILYGTNNVNASGMNFYNLTIGSGTRTQASSLNVDNNLWIRSSTTLTASGTAYTITLKGNWADSGTYTSYTTGTGYILFTGGNNQTLYKPAGGASETMKKFQMNKSGTSTLTLNGVLTVNDTLKMTRGIIVSTSTNYLKAIDNMGLLGGSDSSYVSGVMRKTGNDIFTFPLGGSFTIGGLNKTQYHPLGITAPANTTDEFAASFINSVQTLGSAKVDSLYNLSTCENWTLQRTAGSSNVLATIAWNSNSCNITSLADLTVANWDGAKWADLGGQNLVVNWPYGSLQSVSNVNFTANPVTIIFGSKKNKAPYDELTRTPDGGIYYTGNKLQFKFDDEYNNSTNQNLSYKVLNSSYVNVAPTLVPTINNAALSVYGDNRFRLDLYTNSGPIPSGYYVLEVTNEKNEKWYLRFNK